MGKLTKNDKATTTNKLTKTNYTMQQKLGPTWSEIKTNETTNKLLTMISDALKRPQNAPIKRPSRVTKVTKSTALSPFGPADAACLSAHVYGSYSDSILINGWSINTDYQLNTTDLKAQLYSRVYNNTKEYVYAFAGSGSVDDWINNITQCFGVSKDYTLAAEEGKKISSLLKGHNLYFVGHSKGGGEATLCSMLTNRPAIVFNPAPISQFTKLFNIAPLENNTHNIDIYVNTTDPIYQLLQCTDSESIATKLFGLDKLLGHIHELPLSEIPLWGHSIKLFLDYFDIKYEPTDRQSIRLF